MEVTMRSLTVLFIALAGCSSTATTGPDAAVDSGPTDTGVADSGPKIETNGVLVVGTLASSDLAAIQMQHDQLAKGGEPQAVPAGDIAHTVMLGTKLLGTKENEFLALDRWTSPANIDAFYSNPQFALGFSMLFAAPPSRAVYEKRPTWAGYGTVDSAKAFDPHYWVVVRGTLKQMDDAQNQMAHDTVVGGAKDQAMALGDVAHVVYTGRDDKRQYLSFDVWKDSTNLEAFYSNPQFQMAIGGVFESVSLSIYHSTHWYQW
jgi:quinol monooxygenase YgiN